MLRNNIEFDMKVKYFEEHKPQSKIAEEIGGHMPDGFFIYQAEASERLIYENKR